MGKDGAIPGGSISTESKSNSAGRATSAIGDSTPLSPAIESNIRLLPGNDRCADCQDVFPQWASVSFGILICLNCAGKHRSLGVNVSFVKSLTMDSWFEKEKNLMKVGGNGKWHAVTIGSSIHSLTVHEKYHSDIATLYRQSIVAAAEENRSLMANEFLRQNLNCPPSAPVRVPCRYRSEGAAITHQDISSTSDVFMIKCTTCYTAVAVSDLNTHSKYCVIREKSETWSKYKRSLGVAGCALGFSLTKTKTGHAEVTKISPGGQAERENVLLGSVVIGINGKEMTKYDEIIHCVNTTRRPITFDFAVRQNDTCSSMSTRSLTVPEPINVGYEVTFWSESLGCTFTANDCSCIVKHVFEGSDARRGSILVGSRVVEVNGQKCSNGFETLRRIESSSRPLVLKLMRAEGLMREWDIH